MAARGVDVCNRNGSRDLYLRQSARDGDTRQFKRRDDQDLRRNGGLHVLSNRTRLVSEKGELREKGVQQPPEKKRKFSPIVWDVEDKVTRPPPSEKTNSPDTILTATEISIEAVDVAVTRNSSSESQISAVMSPGPGYLTSVQSTETRLSGKHPVDDFEEGQLDEEQVVEAPSITTSRWGTCLTSPKDELTSPADNVSKTSRWNRSSLSPECGEFPVSEDQQSNSSGSGSGHRSLEPLSAHEYSDLECCTSDHDESENEEPASSAQGGMNMLLDSRSVNEFQKLNKINEGTYGIVYKARDEKTKEIVALKKIKIKEDAYTLEYGFPLTSLREISILLSCNHPSIVNVKEVVVGGRDGSDVFMVMEHLEHDLKGLMDRKKQPFSTSEVKCLMIQLLEGVKYLHTNWIIHRDLKPSNLLMNNSGELKICDFGMARQYGSPIKPYTQMVVTQWYRPPELLLGAKEYSTAVDMWSIGCIMAELLSRKPLFQGKNELDQLQKIFAVLGTPSETIWPGFSSLPGAKAKFPKQSYNLLRKVFPTVSFSGGQTLSERGFDLLNSLLTLDPEKRLTVEEALNHGWFLEVPLPKSKEFMPTFPPLRT